MGLCVLGVLSASCGVNGLALRQDHRVAIVRPPDRSSTGLPVTVTWSVQDFALGPGAGSFGVFVDRAPQRPGKTLAWLFRNAADCRGSQTCLTDRYLAQQNVYRTTSTTFAVERVRHFTRSQRRSFHEVTIVLLDQHERRIGEGAWSVQFMVQSQG